jgi:hypothetical protein
MTERTDEISPQLYARIAGTLYLLLIILGGVGEYARNKIMVPDDAAATAANLTSMETLWRFGITSEFLALICAIGMAMIYFFLLRPVSKELNVLATLLRIVAIAVQAVAVLSLVAALFPLGDAAYLKAFTPEQLAALVRLAIRWHAYGYSLALFFFGSCFLVHGRLIFRSGFLPKTLGILIQIAGVCYLMNSLALFLAPTIAGQIFPAILLPCFVAEFSLCLWLLVKGVNVQKWQERARVVLSN